MIGLLLVLAAAGQVPVASAVTAKPLTLQQRFDAATLAATEGRCKAALQTFATLEGTNALKKNPLFAAAFNVRKGGCLVRTGLYNEGVATIRNGLPALIAEGAEFKNDVYEAHLALGAVAWSQLDYDTAEKEYRAAIDGSQGANRIHPLMMLSRVLMFDHDGRALAAATEARTLALATPGFEKTSVANIQTQYARVLLNEGRNTEAYAELKNSLAKQGGLDLKVNVSDVATRSDLAIAAFKNKDMDGALRYLAYSGAGHMKDAPFARAAAMDLPVCGGEAGLSPDDVAIVEFSLETDGRVSGVAPIFTTGRRAAALAFAGAVADWSWTAKDAGTIPALFRYATRVELRCVKAPSLPKLIAPLREAAQAWIATKGVVAPAWDNLSAAAALPLQRAALIRAKDTQDGPAMLQATLALVANPVSTVEEVKTAIVAAESSAASLKASAPVRAYLAITALGLSEKNGTAPARDDLRALIGRSDLAGDALAVSTLRMLAAAPADRASPPKDADKLFDAVIAESGLPDRHPLKIAAMLGKANTLAAHGDIAGARAVFDRTGLSAEQCALVGLQPVLKRSGVSASDFPHEAAAMGFEGWVSTEFDIAPDGKTLLPRAVTAYPPFVFDTAAVNMAQGMRYASTFRPEGALACSGQRMSISFNMPR